MVRLRVPPERISGSRAELGPEDAAYLWRVLRLRPGDRLEAFDGQGRAYPATISSLSQAAGRLELGPMQSRVQGANPLTLWQALLKTEKLEWVIQKCTELGVRTIVPFRSLRSVVKLSDVGADKKVLRWQKVAQQASRQCGRSDVPRVERVQAFDDLCELARNGARVGLFHEGATDESLAHFIATDRSGDPGVAIAVGPEGGFDPSEVQLARGAGASILSLGSRVLRAETAGLVVCTLAAWLSGDLD